MAAVWSWSLSSKSPETSFLMTLNNNVIAYSFRHTSYSPWTLQALEDIKRFLLKVVQNYILMSFISKLKMTMKVILFVYKTGQRISKKNETLQDKIAHDNEEDLGNS